MTSKLLNIAFIHNQDQRRNYERMLRDGVCPFCAENLSQYHRSPILHRGRYWLVTPNDYPYDKTRHHLLLISHRHVESLSQLPAPAGSELIKIIQNYEQTLRLKGGTIVLRFGEGSHTGASIRHLHAHLIVPDLKNLPKGERISIHISGFGL